MCLYHQQSVQRLGKLLVRSFQGGADVIGGIGRTILPDERLSQKSLQYAQLASIEIPAPTGGIDPIHPGPSEQDLFEQGISRLNIALRHEALNQRLKLPTTIPHHRLVQGIDIAMALQVGQRRNARRNRKPGFRQGIGGIAGEPHIVRTAAAAVAAGETADLPVFIARRIHHRRRAVADIDRHHARSGQ